MQFTTKRNGLLILLTLAGLLLAVGLITPIITFKKFFFIQNTFSILTTCWNLLKQEQWFLFIVITLFSVILPIIKLSLLFKLVLENNAVNEKTKRLLNLMHRFAKWSMLDVFVVAILVVVVKLGAIGNVEKHIGLYAYAAAAVLIMILTNKVVEYVEERFD